MFLHLIPTFRSFVQDVLAHGDYDHIVLVDRKAARLFRVHSLVPDDYTDRVSYRSALTFSQADLSGSHVAIFDDVAYGGRTLAEYRHDLESQGAIVDTFAMVAREGLDPTLSLDPTARTCIRLPPDQFRSFQYHTRDYLLETAIPLDADHPIATLRDPQLDPLTLLAGLRGFGLTCLLPTLSSRSRMLCFSILQPPISRLPARSHADYARGINKLRLYFRPTDPAVVLLPIRRPRVRLVGEDASAILEEVAGRIVEDLRRAGHELVTELRTPRAAYDLGVLLLCLDLLAEFSWHLIDRGVTTAVPVFVSEQADELRLRFGARIGTLIPALLTALLQRRAPRQGTLFPLPSSRPSKRSSWAMSPHGDALYSTLRHDAEAILRQAADATTDSWTGLSFSELADKLRLFRKRDLALLSLVLDELYDAGIAKPVTRRRTDGDATIIERVSRPGETESINRTRRAAYVANLVGERIHYFAPTKDQPRQISPLVLYKGLVALSHDLARSERFSPPFEITTDTHGPVPRIPDDANPVGSTPLIGIAELAPQLPLRFRRPESGLPFFYLDHSRVSGLTSPDILSECALSLADAQRIQQFANFYGQLWQADRGLSLLLALAVLRSGEDFLRLANYERKASARVLGVPLLQQLRSSVVQPAELRSFTERIKGYRRALQRKLDLYRDSENLFSRIVALAERVGGPTLAELYRQSFDVFRHEAAALELDLAVQRLRSDGSTLMSVEECLRDLGAGSTNVQSALQIVRNAIDTFEAHSSELQLKLTRWSRARTMSIARDLGDLTELEARLVNAEEGWVTALDIVGFLGLGENRLRLIETLRRACRSAIGGIADAFVQNVGFDGVAIYFPPSVSGDAVLGLVEELIRGAPTDVSEESEERIHVTSGIVPIGGREQRPRLREAAALLTYLLTTIHSENPPSVFVTEPALDRMEARRAAAVRVGRLVEISKRAATFQPRGVVEDVVVFRFDVGGLAAAGEVSVGES